MRTRLVILTILFIFFGARSASAVTFTISNPQQSGNEVTIDVSLSGLILSSCPNGSCYLQAAFTSPTPIRYFGFTKNNNEQWYQYISAPTQSYIQSTFFAFQPVNRTWSGQLTLKVNAEDSNFHGPGTYNIKAWRYSGNSNSASGNSDPLEITIQGSTPTPTPTPKPTPTPTPKPTSKPIPVATPTPTRAPILTANPSPPPNSSIPSAVANQVSPANQPTSSERPQPSEFDSPAFALARRVASSNSRIASVAGTTASADTTASASFSIIWAGLIFIFAGISLIGYIYLKKNAKIHL